MARRGCFIALEFGSYGTDALFDVLLQEHADWNTENGLEPDHPSSRAMREHFCPDDVCWRELVLVKSRQVLAQALTQARSPLVPDVPTFAEAGVPDYRVSTWFSLMAPAGIGQAELQKLSDSLVQVLADPEIMRALGERGVDVMPMPSARMKAYMAEEYALWGKVIQEAGIPRQ